jgi:hypothetical protein
MFSKLVSRDFICEEPMYIYMYYIYISKSVYIAKKFTFFFVAHGDYFCIANSRIKNYASFKKDIWKFHGISKTVFIYFTGHRRPPKAVLRKRVWEELF